MPIFMSDPLPVVNAGERHIPAVLAVDTSGSMGGAPIQELNQGLKEFGIALAEDSLALGRAEVSIITFNSDVQVVEGFRPASEYVAPTLTAGGFTSLNKAIEVALDAIEERKELYNEQGIDWYRPWLFVLTDGAATDTDREPAAMERLRGAIRNNKVVYMPMAIGAYADKEKLREYYPEEDPTKAVLAANAANFREAFVWLSKSIATVSHSNPQVQNAVTLPPTPPTLQMTVGI